MFASTSSMSLEHESQRLGELWRSQGETFLEEQADALIADVDRLRASYLAGVEADALARAARRAPGATLGAVIDLRDADVSGMACTREGHGHIGATARCIRCRNPFCELDVMRLERMHGDALCTECALALGGVNPKRRPLVAPGRPGRPVRR